MTFVPGWVLRERRTCTHRTLFYFFIDVSSRRLRIQGCGRGPTGGPRLVGSIQMDLRPQAKAPPISQRRLSPITRASDLSTPRLATARWNRSGDGFTVHPSEEKTDASKRVNTSARFSSSTHFDLRDQMLVTRAKRYRFAKDRSVSA